MNNPPVSRIHDAAPLCEDEGCPQHGTDHVCVEKPVPTFTAVQVEEAVGKAAAEVWHRDYVPPFVKRVMCILAELEAERKESQQ
jgi:hypothetical protein